MTALSEHPRFGTRMAVHDAVQRISGVSLSTIQKFHQRPGMPVTVKNLDKMAEAVRLLGAEDIAA